MFGSLKHSLLAAVVVFGSAQGSQGDKANLDKERKQFQGSWEVISILQGGDTPADLKDARITFAFDGDKLTVRKDETVLGRASFALDLAAMPRLIDLTAMGNDAGKKVLGIYEMKNDDLKLCLDLNSTDRPAAFESKAGQGQQVLIVLKRVKP